MPSQASELTPLGDSGSFTSLASNLFADQGWPWYFSGPLIFATMVALVLLGKRFGVSSNFDSICSLAGAGRFIDKFKPDGHQRAWNLAFILGAVTGGFISYLLGADNRLIDLAPATVATLASWGIAHDPGFAPQALVGANALFGTDSAGPSLTAWLLLGLGGFCVGFGTRWAAGCTSGHGISGMSDLQQGSIFATLSFFASGAATVHFVLPWLLG
jgi:uncharacterized protein